MIPPYYVTGILAAIFSELNKIQNSQALLLALNSDGQIGYERTDNDCMIELSKKISLLLDEKNKIKYVNNVELKVKRLDFSSNSMYL